MMLRSPVIRAVALGALPFILAAIVWEIVARSQILPPLLFPDLEKVIATFFRLIGSGVLLLSMLGTLGRLLLGFTAALAVGTIIGLLMGRFDWAEDVFMPIVSIAYPIPSLAYAPLFVLWFGLGNLPTVLLVGVASSLPIAINTWKGVRAIKPIWLRFARGIGTNERQLFGKVILPAALPYILTGSRIGLAQAWRALVGAEMLTSVANGLGSLIFGAQQFLNTDVMLAGVAAIGIVGFVMERQIFIRIERMTLARWGMVSL
jgi:NitT/TauT family transport system permease protein